jgi:hypothetical protein
MDSISTREPSLKAKTVKDHGGRDELARDDMTSAARRRATSRRGRRVSIANHSTFGLEYITWSRVLGMIP